MNLVLLGVPGAGKGTQAAALCAKLGLEHFSTGDIFRAEIASKTDVGLKIEGLVKSGGLVSDSLVLEVVKKQIISKNKGFLFDGFPRTVEQAKGLESIFRQNGDKVDAVVYMDLSSEKALERLTSRWTCVDCGMVYNVNQNPPLKKGICDTCLGKLVQRDDDALGVVKKRFIVYREQTEPLVNYYRQKSVFIKIDGSKSPVDVTKDIIKALGFTGKTGA